MAADQSYIRIRYFGPICFTIGQKEEKIKIKSSSINLSELIEKLIKKHGHELEDLLIEEDNQMNENITVYINNQRVDGIKDIITQGDEVYFFIALTGG